MGRPPFSRFPSLGKHRSLTDRYRYLMMMMTKHEPHVYLDYAATAPILPAAFKEMGRVAGLGLGNPSSLHNRGLGARRIIDEARQTLARSLGAEPWQIIFTSGGTESNNLAIGGTALRKRRGHLICSAVEHPSVGECCRRLTDLGYTMDTVPVDRTGRVEPERVLEAIRPDTVLVSIMHANNEIGTIQPVAQIAALVKQANPRILIHTDAVLAGPASGVLPTPGWCSPCSSGLAPGFP